MEFKNEAVSVAADDPIRAVDAFTKALLRKGVSADDLAAALMLTGIAVFLSQKNAGPEKAFGAVCAIHDRLEDLYPSTIERMKLALSGQAVGHA